MLGQAQPLRLQVTMYNALLKTLRYNRSRVLRRGFSPTLKSRAGFGYILLRSGHDVEGRCTLRGKYNIV